MSAQPHTSQPSADNLAVLAEPRAEIDQLDREIIALLNQRAQVCLRLARLKASSNQPVYHPLREAQVLANLKSLNRGPLTGEGLAAIYTEIISACRALQEPLKVAFLGPELGFGHQAAQRHFGRGCRLSPQLGLEEVFQAVERGDCQAALVAVENSAEGAVGSSLDRMLASPLRVCGEIYARVGQVLMSREEDLGAVRTLHAHPQALARSRQWLATHLPGVALAEAPDLATAARLAAADPGSAALGTELAARETGLGILAREVQDAPQATTRYWVLGPDDCPAIGDDKTSLAFATAHQPGSLHRALGCFVGHGLNLTRIESRPTPRRPWEYTFFVDLLGHREDPAVAAAVAELTRELPLVRMLGSYPRGEAPAGRGRG